MKITTVTLGFKSKQKIVAVGANAKNTVCLLSAGTARISPVFKNPDDPKEYLSFAKTVSCFLKEKPAGIACDHHPDYPSTRLAEKSASLSVRRIKVWHHHAHIASCMAENGLGNEKVIGIAFDGTGLGPDNTFWGAEVLISDYKGFRRFAHLKEIPLAGGERAIMEPWRGASFWLHAAYKNRFLKLGIPFTKKIKTDQWRLMQQMAIKKVNVPVASSMGRLFDAAASVILARPRARFEAELAMELQSVAGCCSKGQPYRLGIATKGGQYIFDPRPLFTGIVSDIKKHTPAQEISCRFHASIARMVRDACCLAAQRFRCKKVVLSGGVFQNTILLNLCLGLLYKEGFKVYSHQKLSCSDSGISLGQAVIASFQEV